MSITYPVAPGLAQKLMACGLGISVVHFEDGHREIRTPDDAAAQAIIDAYTLAEEAAYHSAQITEHARQLRERITAGAAPGEMASWPIKRSEAMLVAAEGPSAPAPLLTLEAAARGVSIEQIAARVLSNAAMLGGLEAQISGLSGKHRDALAACTSFDEIAAYDWHEGWPAL